MLEENSQYPFDDDQNLSDDQMPALERTVFEVSLDHLEEIPLRILLREGGDVQRERILREVTQKELSDGIGCSISTIQKIETNQRTLTIVLADQIADFLAPKPILRVRPPHPSSDPIERVTQVIARAQRLIGDDYIIFATIKKAKKPKQPKKPTSPISDE